MLLLVIECLFSMWAIYWMAVVSVWLVLEACKLISDALSDE